jgi:hypothetical protein
LRRPLRRRGRRGGLGVGFEGIEFGIGIVANIIVGVWRVEVVVVGGDGGVDGIAPAVGAEGVDVFVLGEAGGLHQGLEHVGNGAGEPGFYFAADYGGDEAAQGCV